MTIKQIHAIPGGTAQTPMLGVDDEDSGGAGLAAHAATLNTHKTVAIGLMFMDGAPAWVGAHPGFAALIDRTGAGNQTAHLAADGDPATMFARCNPMGENQIAAMGGVLHGVGNRDLDIIMTTYEGADSLPGGWGAGAVLGSPIASDGYVIVEVIQFT